MLKDSIKKYCEELAKSDVDFATHYNPEKLTACCNYITTQARKLAIRTYASKLDTEWLINTGSFLLTW